MTLDAELAAVRAVARQLRGATTPLGTHRLSALASALDQSARAIRSGYEFLREEAAGRKRSVELGDPEPYAGLAPAQALTVLVDRCRALSSDEECSAASEAEVERRLTREVDGLLASGALADPRSARQRRGVSSSHPGSNGPGAARSDASRTSKAAAVAAEPRSGTNRRAVLDAVTAVARDPRTVGLTDVEIQRATGLNPNSARPRRVELVEGGWLMDSGVTREHFGREHIVWVLTDKGSRFAAGLPVSA